MYKNRWILALAILLIAILACNSGTAVTAVPTGTSNNETPAPIDNGFGSDEFKTEFPLPENVSNFTDMGNGEINFQTKTSINDIIALYREAFSEAGYKERSINTTITETTFSIVFDGHASGKAIVIQGVDLGSGNTNINIRFEDV